MEVKQFFKELERMCRNTGVECNNACPICSSSYRRPFGLHGIDVLDLFQIIKEHENIIDEVEQWAKEHPHKTRAHDFFQKHPNAPKSDYGTPVVCAYDCGYLKETCKINDGIKCEGCWNEPAE